jgi:hypothetical protein
LFLGLANFCRHFILNFSKLTGPMMPLLKKNNKFRWLEGAQEVFEKLHTAFTLAPILRHLESSLPVVLETDASDFTLGAVISQRDPENRVLHPITFNSHKFNSVELNYENYNKEMLAIMETMDHYWHYFEGLSLQSIIFSDHRNLLWFTEMKVYNRRQARWAEKLSCFDFKIVFHPGRQGGKPDALSCRPDYTLGNDMEACTMTFLKPDQVDTSLLDDNRVAVAPCIMSATSTINLGANHARADTIQTALETDGEISRYLPYLCSLGLFHPDEVAQFLQPFSMDGRGLVL